jgi:hypothetical protein
MEYENKNIVHEPEPQPDYEKAEIDNRIKESEASDRGFVNISEDEKLLVNVNRPDIEKLQLFTKMVRRSKTLKRFKIIDSNT